MLGYAALCWCPFTAVWICSILDMLSIVLLSVEECFFYLWLVCARLSIVQGESLLR